MKRYGYHRTSTREQHLDRGIAEITAYCEQNQLELERIFTDQQTGKTFNRPRYQVLKEDVLRSGDELIITEVDRLGRNKRDTLKELQYFRDHNIRVKILELPTTLMDISKLDNTIADWALHDKGDGNPHAHIMLTCRGINENHEWDKKTRTVFANAVSTHVA